MSLATALLLVTEEALARRRWTPEASIGGGQSSYSQNVHPNYVVGDHPTWSGMLGLSSSTPDSRLWLGFHAVFGRGQSDVGGVDYQVLSPIPPGFESPFGDTRVSVSHFDVSCVLGMVLGRPPADGPGTGMIVPYLGLGFGVIRFSDSYLGDALYDPFGGVAEGRVPRRVEKGSGVIFRLLYANPVERPVTGGLRRARTYQGRRVA